MPRSWLASIRTATTRAPADRRVDGLGSPLAKTVHPRLLTVLAFAGVAAVTGLSLQHLASGLGDGPPAASAESGLELWTADAVDPAGRVRGSMQICTDAVVRDGFTRALPQINGERCLVVGQPAMRPGLFAARCVAAGQKYGVSVSTTGDVERGELAVRVRMQPLYVDHPGAVQLLRYRRVGACPESSRVGDSIDRQSGSAFDALDPRGG